MTIDQEKLQKSIDFVAALARGCNPCDGEYVEDGVLNDVRVVRGLYEVRDVLLSVQKQQEGKVKVLKSREYLTEENLELLKKQLSDYPYSEYNVSIRTVIRNVGELIDQSVFPAVSRARIELWLQMKGLIQIVYNDENNRQRVITPEGTEAGIVWCTYETRYGNERDYIGFNRKAQAFIVENYGQMLAETAVEIAESRRGKYWTDEEVEILRKKFHEGMPIQAIAETMKRSAPSVRYRLRMLGLI